MRGNSTYEKRSDGSVGTEYKRDPDDTIGPTKSPGGGGPIS